MPLSLSSFDPVQPTVRYPSDADIHRDVSKVFVLYRHIANFLPSHSTERWGTDWGEVHSVTVALRLEHETITDHDICIVHMVKTGLSGCKVITLHMPHLVLLIQTLYIHMPHLVLLIQILYIHVPGAAG